MMYNTSGLSLLLLFLPTLCSSRGNTQSNSLSDDKILQSRFNFIDFEHYIIPSIFPNIPPYVNVTGSRNHMKNTIPQLFEDKLPNSYLNHILRFFHSYAGYCKSKRFTSLNFNQISRRRNFTARKAEGRKTEKKIGMSVMRQINAKDLMIKNLEKMVKKFGEAEFPFVIPSFVLPEELNVFKTHWEHSLDKVWVVKPVMGSNSRGVYAVTHWNQIQLPETGNVVVQKYIANPYLINGAKTEFRVYVVVTGWNPIRAYISYDGIVKVGLSNFSMALDTLNDPCIHFRPTGKRMNECLPENSKESVLHLKSEEPGFFDMNSHTLDILKNKDPKFNLDRFMEQVNDAVIKILFSIEQKTLDKFIKKWPSSYSSFNFQSFDFFMDANYKVWLNEVNGSPTFLETSRAPQEAVTLGGYHLPPELPQEISTELLAYMNFRHEPLHDPKLDDRLYSYSLSEEELKKHKQFAQAEMNNNLSYLGPILENLTPDDVRKLVVAEDELARIGSFQRLLPPKNLTKYIDLIEFGNRYYYYLFDAWKAKYGTNRSLGTERLKALTQTKFHLQP